MRSSKQKRRKSERVRSLEQRRVLLGVTGSIAAYKALDIVRKLDSLGAEVIVIMTRSAMEFVGPLSFETLSRNEVVKELFPANKKVGTRHIDLASSSDLLIIAPATANMIGKIASGVGDCILSTIAYAVKKPIVFAPAMNTRLWENPIVRENCRKLEALGNVFVGPERGDLACGESGSGRMSEPDKIVERVSHVLAKKLDLAGKTVLVTAGGTREYIDPVRFISNGSTGKMGFALAKAASGRGADVHLIAGFTSADIPGSVKYEFTRTAEDMSKAVVSALVKADAVIMSAAVSDFKPERTRSDKVKSKTLTLKLNRCPDILRRVAKSKRKGTFIVGFSLETKDTVKRAKSKIQGKDLDMIVCNTPESMGADKSRATIVTRKGEVEILPLLSKDELANRIMDRVRASIG
jgi:phosphopantothenoylcysteine decarboxylase/phosphopantothenate--cysteine ligase